MTITTLNAQIDDRPEPVEVDRYIVLTPDNKMHISGITNAEMLDLAAKLTKLAVQRTAEAAYDSGYQSGIAGEDDNAPDAYDRIQEDIRQAGEGIIITDGEQL